MRLVNNCVCLDFFEELKKEFYYVLFCCVKMINRIKLGILCSY